MSNSGLYDVAATSVVGSDGRDLIITFTDINTGLPRDLSGYTVRAQGASDDIIKTFDIPHTSIGIPTGGTVNSQVTWASFFGALAASDLGLKTGARFSFRPLLIDPVGRHDYSDGFDVQWLAPPAVGTSPVAAVPTLVQTYHTDIMAITNNGSAAAPPVLANIGNQVSASTADGPYGWQWNQNAQAACKFTTGLVWPTGSGTADPFGTQPNEAANFGGWGRRNIMRGLICLGTYANPTVNTKIGVALNYSGTAGTWPGSVVNYPYVALVAILGGATPHWELWVWKGVSGATLSVTTLGNGVPAPATNMNYPFIVDFNPATGVQVWVSGRLGATVTDLTVIPPPSNPVSPGSNPWGFGVCGLMANEAAAGAVTLWSYRDLTLDTVVMSP